RPELARILVVALPDLGAARAVVINARKAQSALDIVARARDPRAALQLKHLGVREAVEPELQGGLELLRHALTALSEPAGAERIVGHVTGDGNTKSAHTGVVQEESRAAEQSRPAP